MLNTTRLGFTFGTLAILMALTFMAGNSAAISHGHAVQGSTSQMSLGYSERLGVTVSAEFS